VSEAAAAEEDTVQSTDEELGVLVPKVEHLSVGFTSHASVRISPDKISPDKKLSAFDLHFLTHLQMRYKGDTIASNLN
jgi:hypothetical protein